MFDSIRTTSWWSSRATARVPTTRTKTSEDRRGDADWSSRGLGRGAPRGGGRVRLGRFGFVGIADRCWNEHVPTDDRAGESGSRRLHDRDRQPVLPAGGGK